ncbi:nitrate/nitrite transporter [Alkalilimnicola ehrlichii]|uniref:Nitrate/nitrite transporter n=1 Tax=Alkalilimnicola ehrlichii TaxID=351052 RepID=A0A3E0WX08_9GAMM|nr:NarK family nitrate/nitrite MFS transporter [Alkalilimnicola ehrlichii]RFA29946.1 nitrate/nitrite transporter [Alkalilimnicola ehrlichii]RFA36535.1 nitrate/nitrite transporter [Alkalilimnicola ehrlichii]
MVATPEIVGRDTGKGRVLTDWRPEDPRFWHTVGKPVAARNLGLSIPALALAFAVWMVWSVVVVNLPYVGFDYSTNQLFWLAALPGLSGATLRVFFAFMVPIFGGRRWTALSTAALAIPALGIGFATQNPETPYWVMAVLAAFCGVGGGNFASSMANVNYFFPRNEKGTALGLNAGLGNLGVSLMQFLVPVAITAGVFGALGGSPLMWSDGEFSKPIWLQNAGFIWVPFILLSAVAAWFGMNDIASAKASFKDQAVVFRRKHNWLMSWLYIGTFGSFIGFSAGFPMLTTTLFPGVDAMQFAFIGPLLAALVRPVGGWVSDRVGGALVTLWTFVLMAAAVLGVMYFLPTSEASGNFYGFLSMFLLLFILAGVGNGSTFRMIPVIFLNQWRKRLGNGPLALERATSKAAKESGAALGFSSAVGAFGGFFIPGSYGVSITLTGGVQAALFAFVAFYASCIAITWWYYARHGAEAPC